MSTCTLAALTTQLPATPSTDRTGRTVHVVSHVYWNGDEQGGGGFYWYNDPAAADRQFYTERAVWGTGPARVRLVDVAVPFVLTDAGITDYIDGYLLDDVESFLPARKVALCLPETVDAYRATVEM